MAQHGGGWHAIRYAWKKAREAGGLWKMYRALRTRNACKTCALGMGGQQGGMVNEIGGFPEVCKKSLQAMVSDMQGAIREEFWKKYSVAQLQQFSSRELNRVDGWCSRCSMNRVPSTCGRLAGMRQTRES